MFIFALLYSCIIFISIPISLYVINFFLIQKAFPIFYQDLNTEADAQANLGIHLKSNPGWPSWFSLIFSRTIKFVLRILQNVIVMQVVKFKLNVTSQKLDGITA